MFIIVFIICFDWVVLKTEKISRRACYLCTTTFMSVFVKAILTHSSGAVVLSVFVSSIAVKSKCL